MNIRARNAAISVTVLVTALTLSACKGKNTEPKDLPDLNAQVRPYVTTENTHVKAGPGPQFRTIAQIPQKAKVQVVGRDGDWVLIVSKKGNAPGFIELASVKPSSGEEQESPAPKVEGQFEILTGTQVRSGPGLKYPVVADIGKGTKINVVGEENDGVMPVTERGSDAPYRWKIEAAPLSKS